MQIMPHRDPMLLVDHSERNDDGVISEYTIPDDPYYTRGHFPGNPIVPGVILCEIMAQGSVLLFEEKLKDKLALYAGMDKVRFKRSVRPGDTVTALYLFPIGKVGQISTRHRNSRSGCQCLQRYHRAPSIGDTNDGL